MLQQINIRVFNIQKALQTNMSLFATTVYARVDASAFGNVVNPIINNIVNPLVKLMFAVAIVVFIFGVLQLVWGDEEARKKGKMSIVGGLIGMFIMLSAWGIIYLVANTVAQFQ